MNQTVVHKTQSSVPAHCNRLVLVKQDLVTETTVDVACLITLGQCVPLKLETPDGTHTCHPQTAVKGVNQLKEKALIHTSCCG